MKIPMTFSELLEKYNEDEVFPEDVDDPLRETIKNWYHYRRLCVMNPEMFILFFQRTLSEHYLRYRELLRIEPGISKFDWLVQNYREMQNERIATISEESGITGESTENIENGTETAETLEKDGTVTDAVDMTRTDNLTTEFNGSKTHGGTDSGTYTTTDTHNNLTDTKDRTHTSRTTDLSGTTTTYNNVKDELQHGTGDTETHSQSDTTTTGGYHSEVKKTTPMSASSNNNPVTTGNLIPNGTVSNGQNIGNLDYSYRDGQGLSNDKTESRTAYGHKIVTEGSGRDINTRSGSQTSKGDGGEKKVIDVVSDTNVKSGSIRRENYHSETHGHTITDDDTTTRTGTVDNEGSTTRTFDTIDTKRNSVEGSSEKTIETSTNGEKEQSIDDLVRQRETGRNIEIAKLLARASTYITRTDAFKWLRGEIEPCFYATFLEEDYE